MSRNSLSTAKVRSAPRGSKKGWVHISGQVPPEVGKDFERVLTERRLRATDVICELVSEYVQKKAA